MKEGQRCLIFLDLEIRLSAHINLINKVMKKGAQQRWDQIFILSSSLQRQTDRFPTEPYRPMG